VEEQEKARLRDFEGDRRNLTMKSTLPGIEKIQSHFRERIAGGFPFSDAEAKDAETENTNEE
jgi:hypothetical protein